MTAAIILAGGESTRIGQNKALLQLGGENLIEIMLKKLSEVFDKFYIVTEKPDEYSFLTNVTFVTDIFPDKKSTLEALYSGLLSSTEEINFVCACDMPYLNTKLIKYLLEIKGNYDAVVPVVDDKPVNLHSVYGKNCIPALEKSIAKGNKKISKTLRDLNIKYVPQEALETEDPSLLSFFNIKTYVDYTLVQYDYK